MRMQCQGACSNIRKDQAENNHEIFAEVQANYLNFEQNVAEKKLYISTVGENRPLFMRNRLSAAKFQKLTSLCKVMK